MRPLSIIVAVDEAGGFAKDHLIPWAGESFAKDDFKHFQKVTKGGICIMGRNTYEEMAEMRHAKKKKIKKNILHGRESYVLSRDPYLEVDGAIVKSSIGDVIYNLNSDEQRTIFILGGEKVFTEALAFTTKVYMTIIKDKYDCTQFFPYEFLNGKFAITSGTETDKMYFVEYTRL